MPGKRSTAREVSERLDKVEELLCNGASPGQVEKFCAKTWGISAKHSRKYISDTYHRWQEQTKADMPHRREKLIRMAERFYASAMGAKSANGERSQPDRGPAIQALALLAKLSGAFVQHDPARTELIRNLGQPPADPTLALVWAQRCMVYALAEVVQNESIDPERRLHWISDIGSKLGMTHAKAVFEKKLHDVAVASGLVLEAGDAEGTSGPGDSYDSSGGSALRSRSSV